MAHHEATFQVDSKADAYAVEKLLTQLYDTIREETRSVREGSADSTATLAEFEALRDAAERREPGELTVVYEVRDGEFED